MPSAARPAARERWPSAVGLLLSLARRLHALAVARAWEAKIRAVERTRELESFRGFRAHEALERQQTLQRIAARRAQRELRRQRQVRRHRVAAGAALLIALAALAVMLVPAISSGSRRAVRLQRHAGLSRRARPVGRPTGASPLESLPFPPDPADRATRQGEVPSLYADGLACSVGCRPYGARTGWPLAPVSREHPLRAGLNELRPGSLHVGLDIQARDGAPVYAVQPGVADVLAASGPNGRIRVGNYIYWHVNPAVRTGKPVTAFKTVIGTVMTGYGHIAFSEVNAAGDYVNPLRPDGSVLTPYTDRAAPEIGPPAVAAGGQVVVGAYDPQTFVQRTTYVTPVLAPAALAYRLYDSNAHPVTALEWAFRGPHLLPWLDRSLIYAPGASAPGYACFASRRLCVPRWTYRVAGGFAPPLPPTLAPGRYRLTIYAWDWADNKTALDATVTMTSTGWHPVGTFPTVLFHIPGYFSQREAANRSVPAH